jgi:RNA polymerase sigma-70 factor (ECF subfamily)
MPDELPESAAADCDELVVLARADRAAFGELFDRYYPRVMRYCLRRLPDRAAAEDVTSEVFLQVASHLGGFGGRTETDFRRWVSRIASNAASAQLRTMLRRQELSSRAAASGQLPGCQAGVSSAGERDRLDWPAVYAALLELDERDQTIVTLRFFGDCSHEDIGAVVGLSAGATRTALSRALARLRVRLNVDQRAPTDR